MRVGIPRETWGGELRVAASPSAVRALARAGHAVLVEQGAGAASGWSDDAFLAAGAELVPTAEETFARAGAVWKVHPPTTHEGRLMRAGQRLLSLGNLGPRGAWPSAPDGVEHIRLERELRGDEAPVRAAMSELAGRLAVEVAGRVLQAPAGGRGLFLGGVPGVEPARVVVIGAGVAGTAAATLVAALGAAVRVLDDDITPLRRLARQAPAAQTLLATEHAVERALADADVVIVAVRAAEGPSPKVATRGHLALMQPGAVVVDLSILDGGGFESTPLTDLDSPAQDVDGIVHVGVPNLAGAVPRTASLAYAQAALPAVLTRLADR